MQINGQSSIKFKLGQNAEWFGTATNKFAVDLTLGKRYGPMATPAACNCARS